MKYWYSLFNTFSLPSMFKTNNRPATCSGTFVIVSVLSSETTKYFPTVSKELKSVPSGIFPLFGNKLLDSYMKYFYKNTNKCIKVIPNVVIYNMDLQI